MLDTYCVTCPDDQLWRSRSWMAERWEPQKAIAQRKVVVSGKEETGDAMGMGSLSSLARGLSQFPKSWLQT